MRQEGERTLRRWEGGEEENGRKRGANAAVG